MQFEWNHSKNLANIRKHGIDFSDAIDVFNHPYLTKADDLGVYGEARWVSIGIMKHIHAVVIYTERTDDVIRIISARKATRYEVRCYEQRIKN